MTAAVERLPTGAPSNLRKQVYRLQARIAKAVREKATHKGINLAGANQTNCRVTRPYEVLALYDAKVSRTVLRGVGAGNSPRLPGLRHDVALVAVTMFD